MNLYPIYLTLYLLFLLIFNYYFIQKYCLIFPGTLKEDTDIFEYQTISAFSNSWSLSLEIENLDKYNNLETIKSLCGTHYSNLTLRPTLLFLFLFILIFTSPFILKRLKYLYKAETRGIHNSQGDENTKIVEYKYSNCFEKNQVYFVSLVETYNYKRNRQKNFIVFKSFLVIFFTFIIPFLLLIYLVWSYHLDFSIMRVYKNDYINFFDWYLYTESLSNNLYIKSVSSWCEKETQDVTIDLVVNSSQKNSFIRVDYLIYRNLFDYLYLFFQIIFICFFYYLLYTLFVRYGVGKALTMIFIVYSFLLYLTAYPLKTQFLLQDLLMPSFDFTNTIHDFHFVDSIFLHNSQEISKRYFFNIFQKKIEILHLTEIYYFLIQMNVQDLRSANLDLIQTIHNYLPLQNIHPCIPYLEDIMNKIINYQIDSHFILNLNKQVGSNIYDLSNSLIYSNLFSRLLRLSEPQYLELIRMQEYYLNHEYTLDKVIPFHEGLTGFTYFSNHSSSLQNILFTLFNCNISSLFYALMPSKMSFSVLNILLVDIDKITVYFFLLFFIVFLTYWFLSTPYTYLFTIPGISKNFFGAFPMVNPKESKTTNTFTQKLTQRPFLYNHKNDKRIDFFFYNWVMPSTLYLMPFLWFYTQERREFTSRPITVDSHIENESQSLIGSFIPTTDEVEDRIGFFDQISKLAEGHSADQLEFANMIYKEIEKCLDKDFLVRIKNIHLFYYEYLTNLINSDGFFIKIKSVLFTNETGFVFIFFLNLLFIIYDSIQITHKIVQVRILFALRIKKIKEILSQIPDSLLDKIEYNHPYSDTKNEYQNKITHKNYYQGKYESKCTQSMKPKIFILSQINKIHKYSEKSLIHPISSIAMPLYKANREKRQTTKSTFILNNYHCKILNKNESYLNISFWGMQDNVVHTAFKEYISYVRNSYYQLVRIRLIYILTSIFILKFIYLVYPFLQNTFADIASDSFLNLIFSLGNLFEEYFEDIEAYINYYLNHYNSNDGLSCIPFFSDLIQMAFYTNFDYVAFLHFFQEICMHDYHLGISIDPLISFAECHSNECFSKILIDFAIHFMDNSFPTNNQNLYNPNIDPLYGGYIKENPFQWILSETKNYRIKIRNQIIFFILSIDISDEEEKSFKSILDISGLLVVFLIYMRIFYGIYKEFQFSAFMTQRIPI